MAGLQGSTNLGRSHRPEKTRRSWTNREEEVLLAALKELVATGWKSDNGFRPGYVKKLEEAMKKEFPRTDLKGVPHITSRLTIWKKNYASIVTMLSRSGIGFNVHGDNKIDADDEQWEHAIRIDANASKIRGKEWNLFEGWKVVFGKDRATGEGAEDVMEAVNELMHEHNIAEHGPHNDNIIDDSGKEANTDAEDTSVCQSSKLNHEGTRFKKKRKVDENMQTMCDLLGQIHRDTNARLENLAKGMSYQADLGLARKQVFDLINKIPCLSLKESFKVCDKLIKKAERLEFFMGLPESARAEYAMHMLLDEH